MIERLVGENRSGFWLDRPHLRDLLQAAQADVVGTDLAAMKKFVGLVSRLHGAHQEAYSDFQVDAEGPVCDAPENTHRSPHSGELVEFAPGWALRGGDMTALCKYLLHLKPGAHARSNVFAKDDGHLPGSYRRVVLVVCLLTFVFGIELSLLQLSELIKHDVFATKSLELFSHGLSELPLYNAQRWVSVNLLGLIFTPLGGGRALVLFMEQPEVVLAVRRQEGRELAWMQKWATPAPSSVSFGKFRDDLYVPQKSGMTRADIVVVGSALVLESFRTLASGSAILNKAIFVLDGACESNTISHGAHVGMLLVSPKMFLKGLVSYLNSIELAHLFSHTCYCHFSIELGDRVWSKIDSSLVERKNVNFEKEIMETLGRKSMEQVHTAKRVTVVPSLLLFMRALCSHSTAELNTMRQLCAATFFATCEILTLGGGFGPTTALQTKIKRLFLEKLSKKQDFSSNWFSKEENIKFLQIPADFAPVMQELMTVCNRLVVVCDERRARSPRFTHLEYSETLPHLKALLDKKEWPETPVAQAANHILALTLFPCVGTRKFCDQTFGPTNKFISSIAPLTLPQITAPAALMAQMPRAFANAMCHAARGGWLSDSVRTAARVFVAKLLQKQSPLVLAPNNNIALELHAEVVMVLCQLYRQLEEKSRVSAVDIRSLLLSRLVTIGTMCAKRTRPLAKEYITPGVHKQVGDLIKLNFRALALFASPSPLTPAAVWEAAADNTDQLRGSALKIKAPPPLAQTNQAQKDLKTSSYLGLPRNNLGYSFGNSASSAAEAARGGVDALAILKADGLVWLTTPSSLPTCTLHGLPIPFRRFGDEYICASLLLSGMRLSETSTFSFAQPPHGTLTTDRRGRTALRWINMFWAVRYGSADTRQDWQVEALENARYTSFFTLHPKRFEKRKDLWNLLTSLVALDEIEVVCRIANIAWAICAPELFGYACLVASNLLRMHLAPLPSACSRNMHTRGSTGTANSRIFFQRAREFSYSACLAQEEVSNHLRCGRILIAAGLAAPQKESTPQLWNGQAGWVGLSSEASSTLLCGDKKIVVRAEMPALTPVDQILRAADLLLLKHSVGGFANSASVIEADIELAHASLLVLPQPRAGPDKGFWWRLRQVSGPDTEVCFLTPRMEGEVVRQLEQKTGMRLVNNSAALLAGLQKFHPLEIITLESTDSLLDDLPDAPPVLELAKELSAEEARANPESLFKRDSPHWAQPVPSAVTKRRRRRKNTSGGPRKKRAKTHRVVNGKELVGLKPLQTTAGESSFEQNFETLETETTEW